MSEGKNTGCPVCHKTSEEISFLKIDYKGDEIYICPQLIPLLIYEPEKLIGTLEVAENMQAG